MIGMYKVIFSEHILPSGEVRNNNQVATRNIAARSKGGVKDIKKIKGTASYELSTAKQTATNQQRESHIEQLKSAKRRQTRRVLNSTR